MTEPSPEDIRGALDTHQLREIGALPGRTNHIHAGVLLPLVYRPDLRCVATVRPSHMRLHAGEVCFPGGTREEHDSDLSGTALREAREEIGLAKAELLGPLSSLPVYTSDHRIFPFVAAVNQRDFQPNPSEVAEVIELPVREILQQSSIHGLNWKHGLMQGVAPLFELEDKLMYGATAHAFYEFLGVVAPLWGLPVPPLVPGRYTWADVLPKAFQPPDRSAS